MSAEKNDPQSSTPRQGSKRSAIKWFGGIVVTILVLVGVVYMVQQASLPDVDENETLPLTVSGDDGSDQTSDTASLDLPPNSITAGVSQTAIDEAEHPFDPLLKIAELGKQSIDENINDYTATVISQVRLKGKLQDERYMFCKIRHGKTVNGKKIPFSVYTRFLKPKSVVGQEALWVDGENDGNLVAHTTGIMNMKRFYLAPDSRLAMDGSLHPITMIGFRNLIISMAKTGKRDRQHGECTAQIKRGVKINDSICTMLEVVHPVKRDHFDSHIARIYIDDKLNIPVAYEGYLWPEKEGEEPPLLEKYYYTDLKINVGLTDTDFDPGNKEYDYPAW